MKDEMIAAKIALVTGGSRGIGRAIVLDLARLGWVVMFSYLSNTQAAGDLVSELDRQGPKEQPSRPMLPALPIASGW